MIANEKQYQITKRHLKDFRTNLDLLQNQASDEGNFLHPIHINTVKAKIEDFEREIKEYECLKNGEVSLIHISMDELPHALIKGRIARGWSQGELARQLEMKEQQIQRYEATNYASISFSALQNIANVIGLSFGDVRVKVKDKPVAVPGMDQETIARFQNKIRSRKYLMDYSA